MELLEGKQSTFLFAVLSYSHTLSFNLSLVEETYHDGAELSFPILFPGLFISPFFKIFFFFLEHLNQVAILSSKHSFGVISRGTDVLLIMFHTAVCALDSGRCHRQVFLCFVASFTRIHFIFFLTSVQRFLTSQFFKLF